MIGNPSRLTTYSIQFSPLLTSHSGMYTCQATISSPYQTIQQSAAITENVSVQSELKQSTDSLQFYSHLHIVVPPPVLSVLPLIAPVYGGSFLTLNCTIQLSSAVDIDVTVASMWRKNGALLQDSAWRRMSNAIQTNFTNVYKAQLIFRPVQLNTDDGLYTCDVTVVSELMFVQGSGSQSNNVSLHAVGMLV